MIQLSSFTALLLFEKKAYLTPFGPDQLQALAGLILETRAAGHVVAVPFFALGSVVFCHLLFKSRYVPRTLAASEMAAMTSLVSHVSSVSVLLFQIAVGFWLLIKGVRDR